VIIWLMPTAAAVTCGLLTGVVRSFARRTGMLDRPNARSSHSVPVPRGGGVAIVLVALSIVAGAGACGWLSVGESMGWTAGGAMVAVVGFLDDLCGVPVKPRLLTHLIAAGTCIYVGGGLAPLPWFGASLNLGAGAWVVGTIALAWSINLFNFMDGIDGLAASEAAFVFAGAAALTGIRGPAADLPVLLALCGASLGFLVWNWAPARIFMGDSGSGFLGLCIGAAAVYTSANGSLTLWTWLVLYAAFTVDATVTLVTRLVQGERLSSAHRTHAYQRLARHFGSHARVTCSYAAVNAFWLLPIATWSAIRPESGAAAAMVAIGPLVVLAVWLGAGRPNDISQPL